MQAGPCCWNAKDQQRPRRVCTEQNNQELISQTENPFCSQRCYLLHPQMASRAQRSSPCAVRLTQCKQLLNTLSGQPAAALLMFVLYLCPPHREDNGNVCSSLCQLPQRPREQVLEPELVPQDLLTYRGQVRQRFRAAHSVSTLHHLNASNSINTNYSSSGISKHRQNLHFQGVKALGSSRADLGGHSAELSPSRLKCCPPTPAPAAGLRVSALPSEAAAVMLIWES